MSGSAGGVEHAIRCASPAALPAAVADYLAANYGATEVELYLVDYRMSRLCPVRAAESAQPLATSELGRALREHAPLVQPAGSGFRLILPMRARGTRIGVLTMRLAERPGAELGAELLDLAETTGNAVLLEDLRTDTFHRVRREQRLTLAAEMQWQLLPGRGLSQPEFDLAGQLEPAYQLSGDNFDWSVDAEHLMLTVSNGMGEGVNAAMLTSLAINALRNARRTGLPLAEQAALADQALWAQFGGSQHVATLLLQFELATGLLRVVDAGSPRAWLVRDGALASLALDAQLPLGMFADTRFVAQEVRLQPGDRLVVLSDGVFAARAGELRYADSALQRIMVGSRGLSVHEMVRTVLTDLIGFFGSAELVDDAVAVCLDWHGRQQPR